MNRVYKVKHVFLKLKVLKQTLVKANEMHKEGLHQLTLEKKSVTRLKRPRGWEQARQEEIDQSMDVIHAESHFNCIKIHLISHIQDYIS